MSNLQNTARRLSIRLITRIIRGGEKNMKWYFMQLFPVWYHTKYKENGKTYISWWKMWFGRCYKQKTFEVAA